MNGGKNEQFSLKLVELSKDKLDENNVVLQKEIEQKKTQKVY